MDVIIEYDRIFGSFLIGVDVGVNVNSSSLILIILKSGVIKYSNTVNRFDAEMMGRCNDIVTTQFTPQIRCHHWHYKAIHYKQLYTHYDVTSLLHYLLPKVGALIEAEGGGRVVSKHVMPQHITNAEYVTAPVTSPCHVLNLSIAIFIMYQKKTF